MKRITVPGFDRVNGRPLMVYHEFEMGDDGILRHWIDGTLRAEVPAEGQEVYLSEYPDAESVMPVIASQDKTGDNSGSSGSPDLTPGG